MNRRAFLSSLFAITFAAHPLVQTFRPKRVIVTVSSQVAIVDWVDEVFFRAMLPLNRLF